MLVSCSYLTLPWWSAGHSLGGALATLAAFDIAKELRLTDIHVVTFGAPRTGNRAFAQEYEQMVPDTWHIINAKARHRFPYLAGGK